MYESSATSKTTLPADSHSLPSTNFSLRSALWPGITGLCFSEDKARLGHETFSYFTSKKEGRVEDRNRKIRCKALPPLTAKSETSIGIARL